MGIETFGGGEAVITTTDSQQVTYAIMVNVEMKSEDRELNVPRPLYEYPLLKKLYSARGGIAKLDPTWLVRKTGEDAVSRYVSLSRATLRAEAARLAREFRMPMQSGGFRSFFKEVYGEGTTSTFYKAVADLAKGYKDLRAAALAAKRQITIEEWEALAKVAEPQMPDFDMVDSMQLDAIEGPAVVGTDSDTIEDPIADIQNGLTDKGWSPDVCLAVATQHGAGKVDAKSLNTIPEIGAKPTMLGKLLADYAAIVNKSAVA